jgi:hypothetical protein
MAILLPLRGSRVHLISAPTLEMNSFTTDEVGISQEVQIVITGGITFNKNISIHL